MILVTGAGGKTGKALIKALSGVESVRAFVRHEKDVAVAASMGTANVIVGDMREEATVRAAVQNVRAVYHICPNMSPDELVIGKLVLAAGREAGVEHFVYHSVLHPQTERMSHHWQKLRVEEMVFESGLPFTILQPAPYMQNLLANWKSMLDTGILQVPYSIEAKVSFVDLEDIAQAAKIVLSEANHKNAIYEIAGTPPMSHVEVAQIFSQVLEREIRAEKEEIGNWRLRVGGTGMYAVEFLVSMFEYYDRWGLVGNPNVLQWVLKRKPTSLASFAERTMRGQTI